MTDRAIILGEFVDYRRVKGRKVLQLFIEVPLDHELATLNALGAPAVGASNWVSVARLTDEAVSLLQGAQAPAHPNSVEATPSPSTTESTPVSEKSGVGVRGRKWSDIPYSQQAAIRCGEPAFQAFMNCESEGQCADEIRHYCGVDTRAEILQGTPAGTFWASLDEEYRAHLTTRQYSEAKRHG